MSTEYGYCTFKDHQSMSMQEMPELSPPGLMPKSIKVVCEDDLVDKVKPGERVEIRGVYKIFQSDQGSIKTFNTVLIANNIQILQNDLNFQLSYKDIELVKEYIKNNENNILEHFSRSIASQIEGLEIIKKALTLQLIGGTSKDLENGTHLRGDINMMVIGDPSTAKSQLIRYVLSTAPLVINTTGKGTSGVGLTAAVVTNQQTGERTLEAGAMVLADGGVVCIDEFDKMSEIDRVAIHEVMEQQTVTISKAGIQNSLNARCSVLAIANPIFGEYNKEISPTRNINMPDSLLSRFDMLFVLLDQRNTEIDRRIATKVLENHMMSTPFSITNISLTDHMVQPHTIKDPLNKAQIYLDNNTISQDFIKKILIYCKQKEKPVLNDQAINFLTQRWQELRQRVNVSQPSAKTLPITVRTFETLIRLSTAHAKLRLSKEITLHDAEKAYNLMHQSLFQEEYVEKQEMLMRQNNRPQIKKKENIIQQQQVNENLSQQQQSVNVTDEDVRTLYIEIAKLQSENEFKKSDMLAILKEKQHSLNTMPKLLQALKQLEDKNKILLTEEGFYTM